MNEREIFTAARQLNDAAERDAFLDKVCAGDQELHNRIVGLLAEHAQLGSFLEHDNPPARTLDQPITEAPGTVIGAYKLMKQIGEGGFGLVFVADQHEPVRRKVALKILKPGMDTRQVIARFEAERQALAIMDHANIAKVFDGGTTPSGRPYFVMELVKGTPITQFCDENRSTPQQRLALFVDVCAALQHAHQKGIIHRDLKPSNVMVTSHDGKPVVKVIDFGVAKAIGGQLTDKTVYTQLAQLIGTPLYMSPEQAGQSGLDIDTRSDIYSLGVLLYELLTGTTPFTKERFKQAAYDEIRRIIREEEPPRPSTRLSDSQDSLPSVAAQRHTEPATLTKLVRGELDWIVMKALEKDRNRRYETANGFAMDVQRYLADEPVQACPPSTGYRLRKFLRRNRVALGTIALVVVTLVAAAAVSTWQAVLATQAEVLAKAEAARANDEAAIAKAVNDFLTEDLLDQARPQNEPDRDIKLRTLVDRAAEKVESRFRDKPLVEAAIRLTLGTIYTSLREGPKAEEQLRRAVELRRRHLGPEHPDTLWTLTNLAWSLGPQHRHAEAGKIHAEVLEIKKRFLDPEDPSVLLSMSGIASCYRGQGLLPEAEKLHRQVAEIRRRVLGPEDRETLQSRTFLAHTIQMQGRHAEAEKILRDVVEIRKRLFRPDHPESLLPAKFLADTLRDLDRLAEAEELYRDLYEIRKRIVGPDHIQTVRIAKALAEVRGRATKAHWDEGRAQSSKGDELLAAGRNKEAADHFRRAITALGKVAEERRATWDYRHQLGSCYTGVVRASSDPEEKKLMLSQALTLREQLVADFPKRKWIWCELGDVYAMLGQWHKAADAQTKEIELNVTYWLAWYRRGRAHASLGQWENAVADLTRSLELKPDNWPAWWHRSQGHIHLKQWANALTDCERAIKLGSTMPEVWVAKAAAHARLNQPDSAIADLQQAVAKGYRNANHLKNYEDLAGLRAREDFKKLVAELEAKNK